jgi:glycosyltransferase involved in cell wall biosynthesis
MPLISSVEPAAKFRIVGAVEDKFRKRYESPQVEFMGTVIDLGEAVVDCVIGVCPIRIGAGVQNKMLDYMALGMPAVTTRIGAEGLEGRDGEVYIVADEPQQMANVILDLLNDAPRRDQLSRQARELMEARYSWEGRLAELPSRILLSKLR